MGKKFDLKSNKRLLVAVLVFAMLIVGSGLAYQIRRNRTQKTPAEQSVEKIPETTESEAEITQNAAQAEEALGPIKEKFEEYKSQILAGTASGTRKAELYVNAAITGSAIKAPEAAEYAKEALNLMNEFAKNNPDNTELLDKLQKISEGKYDEANGGQIR